MLTHLIEERAYLGVQLKRAYQRPWRPLKFALKYWLLSMLSAASRPISGRTSVRFARSAEKRSPTRFDRFLFAEHPEAAENSPAHFVEYGRSRGGPTHSTVRFADYLPYTGTLFQPPSGIAVDIVIPVYRGLEETRRCIETVLADNDRPQGRILVIDDCSPEPELSAWLRSVAADGRIELLRNERNLGFVASVPRAAPRRAQRYRAAKQRYRGSVGLVAPSHGACVRRSAGGIRYAVFKQCHDLQLSHSIRWIFT
jgi:hypothetical protein